MTRETKLYRMLFAWILLLALASTSYSLLISAFNVKNFGDKKRNDAGVMDTIVKIINRYDVILIQEVRDSSKGSSDTIAALKNRGLRGFIHESSDPLGTTSYKENYLFLIRENVGLTVEDRFQYQDSRVTFERPPFSIKLRSRRPDTTGLKQFVLTAIHVKPGKPVTEQEIRRLKDVHGKLKSKWNTDNIIIMGDLNAGDRYIDTSSLNNLPIAKSPFTWLPKDVDTAISCYKFDENTGQAKRHRGRLISKIRDRNLGEANNKTECKKTKKSIHKTSGKSSGKAKKLGCTIHDRIPGETKKPGCPYDRFIITGADLKKYLDPNRAGIFEFNKEYKLTPQQTKAVSDHYPIQLQLGG